MDHPHRQCGEGATEPLQPQEAKTNVACELKPSQTFTDAQLKASYRAVSPPVTARLSRGWCGLAPRITRGKLPTLKDPYSTQCHRKAKKIIKDINHPTNCLFTPLSSRRQGQYRCIKTEKLLLSQGDPTVILSIVMTLALGLVYDFHKYLFPPFSSLYPT
jgi:hypothetical protein